MPFTKTNDFITGRKPVPSADTYGLVAVRFTLDLAVADLALNTIGQIGFLPAGCEPVSLIVDASDMDSGAAAMVLQFGLLDAAGSAFSTAAPDGGAAWGSTTASNTAFQQQILSQPMATVTQAQVDRKLGMKVATAPTTPVAGTVGATLLYRAAQ